MSLERIAVLPANVLIADPASEWLRAASPLVLQSDLATSRNLLVSAVTNESAAFQIGAAQVLRTTIETWGGNIVIRATLTSLASQKNTRVLTASKPASSGFVAVLNSIAAGIDANAATFSTSNDRALESFTAAAEAGTVPARLQMLEDAISIDPRFGLAYLALLETEPHSQGQDVAVVQNGNEHEKLFTPLDRARWNAFVARLSRSPVPVQASGDVALLQIAPNDLDAIANLGSLRFRQNNATEGQRLYRRALELRPGNSDLLRQLAEGLLETRQFKQAENTFLALDNNPSVLPELAVCILLEGDANRANAVFNRFLASRPPSDPLTPLLHGTWLAIASSLPNAIDFVRGNMPNDTRFRVVAGTQIAIWQLLNGDAAAARNTAASLRALDPRPASFAAVASLLAGATADAAEWQAQVNALPLSAEAKETLLGYGFFLGAHYAQAAQIWQQIDRRTGGGDLRARAMLAASLDRAGRPNEATHVLVQPFVPDLADLYAAVSFNEMHRLLRVGVR